MRFWTLSWRSSSTVARDLQEYNILQKCQQRKRPIYSYRTVFRLVNEDSLEDYLDVFVILENEEEEKKSKLTRRVASVYVVCVEPGRIRVIRRRVNPLSYFLVSPIIVIR